MTDLLKWKVVVAAKRLLIDEREIICKELSEGTATRIDIVKEFQRVIMEDPELMELANERKRQRFKEKP